MFTNKVIRIISFIIHCIIIVYYTLNTKHKRTFKKSLFQVRKGYFILTKRLLNYLIVRELKMFKFECACIKLYIDCLKIANV